MTITWKQIDTNGNGYVDGAECTTAKAKGVKNVWDNMTAMDYNTGITREQKLASIIKEFNGGMYQDEIIINCYFGEDADKLRSNDIKNKENQLITMYNQYIQYKLETAEELKDLDEQIGFKPFAGGLTALQDWSNKTFGTSFDTTEGHVEMDKRDKLIDRRNSIMHKLWAMEDDMHRLSHELTSFEQ